MSYRAISAARLLLPALAIGLAGGCASVIDGTTQVVTVETYLHGSQAVANCKLTNSKGVWHVTTPGTTSVQRAYGDLTVDCAAAGLAPVSQPVASSTKALVFGNILLGGVVGAVIDVANGSAYDYPSPINVAFSDVAPSARQKAHAVQPDKGPETGPALDSANCAPVKPPAVFRSSAGGQYYEAFCADGRLLHLACSDNVCRLRTSEDR